MPDKIQQALETLLEAGVRWARNHKKTVLAILLFEAWVHSLVFGNLTQLKQLTELIPFGKLLGF